MRLPRSPQAQLAFFCSIIPAVNMEMSYSVENIVKLVVVVVPYTGIESFFDCMYSYYLTFARNLMYKICPVFRISHIFSIRVIFGKYKTNSVIFLFYPCGNIH
jgi:hypothetical protein